MTCQIINPCGTSDPNNPLGCPLPAKETDVFTGFLLTDGNGTRYKFPNHVAYMRTANLAECGEFSGLTNNLLQGTSDSGNVELSIDPIPARAPDGAVLAMSFKFADGRVFNAGASGTLQDANGNLIGGVDSQGWNLDNMGRRATRTVPLDNFNPPMVSDFQSYDSNGNIQHTRVEYILITPHHSVSTLPFGLAFLDIPGIPMRVLSRILLPNGLSYTFSYDDPDQSGQVNNGELTKITLPAGGYIKYRWQTLPNRDRRDVPSSNVSFPLDALDRIDSRVLIERHVSDGVQESVWHYDYTGGVADAQWTTTVTDPAGNATIHTFQAPTLDAPALEVSVEERQGSATPVRLTTKTWQQDNGPTISRLYCSSPGFGGSGCTGYQFDVRSGPRNLRVSDVTQSWLPSNLTSKTHTDFNDCHSYFSNDLSATLTDCFEHPTKVSEYDYNASAPSRVTTYDYLHNDATVGPAYWNAHILEQVRFKRVYQGDGTTLAAESEYRYDTTALQSATAPYHNDVNGVRGNQTEIRVHQFSPGVDTWLVTQRIYDTVGNLRQSIDPGQHNTFYSYDDSLAASDCAPNGLGKGFVTQVTNHLGQRGQSDYYPCTGLLKASRDENDIQAGRAGTTYTYDFMDRSVAINHPDGGQATFDYHGDAFPLKTTKTVLVAPGSSIVTSAVFDGRGRPVTTTVDSDPGGVDQGRRYL